MAKKYRVTVDGTSYEVEVEELGGSSAPASSSPAAVTAAAPAPTAAPAAARPLSLQRHQRRQAL